MAYGIDSVEARVDAYRGNPQALEKKYAVSKELMDLLALEKLRRERQSAQQELQLKMAAQQGQPQTIAQQREQEAMETSKQDMQKQFGDLMQQRQQQQQKNIQQVAQAGLPSLPAPNAAEPQAMACGGIVAFDEGGQAELTPEQMQKLGLGSALKRKIYSGLAQDPAAREQAAREEYQKYVGPSEEEKAQQQQIRQQTKDINKKAYDPYELNRESLIEFLARAGQAPTWQQGFGLGALASQRMDIKNRELVRQRQMEELSQDEKDMLAQRALRKEAYGQGEKARKEVGDELKDVMTAGANMYGSEQMAARAGASGATNAQEKAIAMANQRFAADPRVKDLQKRLEYMAPGSEEYNQTVGLLQQYQQAYLEQSGIKAPAVSVESPVAEKPAEKPGILDRLMGGLKSLQSGSRTPPPPPGFVAQ